MELYTFIQIMRRYYQKFKLDGVMNNDNNTDRQTITVSAPGDPPSLEPITIYATNGQLTKEAVAKVQTLLVRYSLIDRTLTPEGISVMAQATTLWDATHPGSLPNGWSVLQKATGERIIRDEEDQDIGSLDKDASLSEKDALLIDALANELVGGMTSNPPQDTNNIDIPPPYLGTISTIADNDLQVVQNDLTSQGVRPLSSQEKDSHKADRLFALYSAVTDTMAAKGFRDKPPKQVPAKQIEDACRDNGFKMVYVGQPTDAIYYIVDKDNRPVAGGKLSPGRGDSSYYLTDQAVHDLRNQIQTTILKSPIDSTIPKEQSDRITNAKSKSTSFLAESEEEPDHPGKDPDPPSKEKKGPGTGDPNGPGGAVV